ncbi:MAG: signal peptidase I [Sarcina sp.]
MNKESKYLLKKIWKVGILGIILGVWAINFYALTYVTGISMKSTLNEGDILLISKTETIHRGDIAILDINLKGEEKRIVKRVIGIEDDIVNFRDNKLYINGEKQVESYLEEEMVVCDMEFRVPKGKIFVLGDNRNVSSDSRTASISYIDVAQSLYGKVIYNFNQLKSLE